MPPPGPPTRNRAPRRPPWALVPAVALAAACATGAPAPDETAARGEVLVEVLPRAAELTVDGVALGPGARVVRVPDPRRWYRFRAAFPGFEAAELVEEGAHLAGARIALVLAPAGLEHARPLDLEDGESLALAAEALERRGDHETAVEFAERAAQAAPGAPTVLRVLRDVRGSADRGIEVRNRPQGGTEP